MRWNWRFLNLDYRVKRRRLWKSMWREEWLVVVWSFTDEWDVEEEQFEWDRSIDFSEREVWEWRRIDGDMFTLFFRCAVTLIPSVDIERLTDRFFTSRALNSYWIECEWMVGWDQRRLTRIRRIAETISVRLVGLGTSNEPIN